MELVGTNASSRNKGRRQSGRQAARTQESNKIVSSFSKMWESGMTLRVYYPIYKDEIDGWTPLVHGQFGHQVDIKKMKSLGRVWIPSMAEVDEDDNVTKPDFLLRFARIAKLFLDGEYAGREKVILENDKLPKKAKEEAIKELKDEFEKRSPVVGKRRYSVSTECFVVPLDGKGAPLVDKMSIATQDLSTKKNTDIQKIINDSKRHKVILIEDDYGYVEVEYVMGTTGKRNEDGKASPDGLSEQDTLEKTYPDIFNESIKPRLTVLPEDSDMIKKRNRNFHNIDPVAVQKGIMNFCALNGQFLDGFDDDAEEIDTLKKHAGLLETLRLETRYFKNADEIQPDEEDKVDDSEKTADNLADDGINLAEASADAAEAARKKAAGEKPDEPIDELEKNLRESELGGGGVTE